MMNFAKTNQEVYDLLRRGWVFDRPSVLISTGLVKHICLWSQVKKIIVVLHAPPLPSFTLRLHCIHEKKKSFPVFAFPAAAINITGRHKFHF